MPTKDTPSFIRSSVQADFVHDEPWVLPIDRGCVSSTAPDEGWLFDRLRQPEDAIRAELISRGFTFGAHVDGLRPMLESSARLLATTASLETAVDHAVQEIVRLQAPRGYDISHSEPRWPETIFISAPTGEGQVSALRTLENIVHEAMHLQLTKLEGLMPLISDEVIQMPSPWRRRPRHLRGVLHGAYIFNCISSFFGQATLGKCLNKSGAKYVARRQREIAVEIQQIDFKRLAAGLTPQGFAFLDTLIPDDV